MDTNKIKVLMCGSSLSVKGGMVSVIKNYLGYSNWDDIKIEYIPTHIEAGKVKKTVFFLYAYCRIVLLILCNKCDVIYLHTAERGSFYRKVIIGKTAKLFGKRVIMHHHAAQFEEFYSKLPPKKKHFVSTALEKMDLNIVLCGYYATMFQAISPKARFKILYNAVYTYESNPYHQNANYILFLGELGKRKGVYDLIAAIQKMDATLSDNIKFCICGNGEICEVEKQLVRYGIRDRVAHLGWIDGEEKKKILDNTMINVLPSYNEGMPMTILETMAAGIPNISTNIAAIPEVIDDRKNGILIEPGNIEQLVNAIKLLASDANLRKEYSENAWKSISKEFSVNDHIAKLKACLHDLMR